MDKFFTDDIGMFLIQSEQESDDGQQHENQLLNELKKWEKHQLSGNGMTVGKNRSQSNKHSKKQTKSKPNTTMKQEQLNDDGLSYVSLSKRQRNKLAAKKCRQRKKLYVELMLEEEKILTSEISKVDEELIQMKKKLNTFLAQNKSAAGFTSLNQLEKRLQNLLMEENDEKVQDDINCVMDSMFYRVGATGKERINKLNEYFKQVINHSIPAISRYFLWSSSSEKHWFDEVKSEEEQQKDEFFQKLQKATYFNQQDISMIRSHKSQLLYEKVQLMKIVSRLKNLKEKLWSTNSLLEDEMFSLREILSTKQAANLSVFINKNKHREEFNFLKFEDPPYVQEKRAKPSKKVKIEHY